MKRSTRVAFLAAGVSWLLLAHPGIADDFSEFRIPAHRVFSWDAFLDGSASRQHMNLPDRWSRLGFANARGSTEFLWWDEGDRATTLARAIGRLTLGRRDDETHQELDQAPQRSIRDRDFEERGALEAWDLVIDHTQYPAGDWLGVRIGLNASERYLQTWRDETSDDRLVGPGTLVGTWRRFDSTENSYEGRVAVNGTLQVGRVRNATGVYEAMVMEERLAEAGVLRRPLSSTARRALAALFYVGDNLSLAVDRPARRVWERLEELLIEDGAVDEDGLDAATVQRLAEQIFPGAVTFAPADGLPRSPIQRLRGASVGVSAVSLHEQRRSRFRGTIEERLTSDSVVFVPPPSSNDVRSNHRNDALLGGPRLEWHHPWSRMVQVDVVSQLLLDSEDWDDRMAFSTGEVVAILADRWLARATVSHDRTILRQDGEAVFSGWRIGYGVGLDYYVQDRVVLACRLDEAQWNTWDRGIRQYTRDARFSVGVQYRIQGIFDAPGILPPIRI